MVFLFASDFIGIRKLLFGGLEPGSNLILNKTGRVWKPPPTAIKLRF